MQGFGLKKNKFKQVVWNLRKEGGWEKYQILTNKYSDLLEKVIGDKETDIEEKMVKFENIHNTIKYKSFGKVTISKKRSESERVDEDPVAMEEKAEQLYKEQEKRANDEIKEVKRKKLSKVGNVWEIRKRVIGGGRKAHHEATSIVNPVTGKLVVSKNQIKKSFFRVLQSYPRK